jgi:glycerol-3-phosphate acyltransferase PlsY
MGSIPFAYLVVRWRRGVDLRAEGSGNVGALNSLHVTHSKGIGILVLLLDLAKGAAVVWAAGELLGRTFPHLAGAAVGAVVGHNYSLWLRWKGGRGLATALGAMLVIAPLAGLIWMVLWGAGYTLFREINVGSAFACVAEAGSMFALPFPVTRSVLTLPAGQADVYVFMSLMFAVLLSKLVRPVLEHAGRRRMR